jgi:hypothetical protein
MTENYTLNACDAQKMYDFTCDYKYQAIQIKHKKPYFISICTLKTEDIDHFPCLGTTYTLINLLELNYIEFYLKL